MRDHGKQTGRRHISTEQIVLLCTISLVFAWFAGITLFNILNNPTATYKSNHGNEKNSSFGSIFPANVVLFRDDHWKIWLATLNEAAETCVNIQQLVKSHGNATVEEADLWIQLGCFEILRSIYNQW
jgi:hypothetical protein